MKILEWDNEALDKLCELRIDGYTYDQILKSLEDYGIASNKAALSRFFNSPEGKEQVKTVRSRLAAEWKEEPLAEKFSRVHALVENALKLRRMLRVLDVQDKEWRELSAEFRHYLKQIREEMEPFAVQVSGAESPFEAFNKLLEEEFGDKELLK